jgi:beta-lactamase class A
MNYTDVTSTKTTAERNQLLADIQHALEPFGVRTEITPYSNRHFLADFITSEIRADIDFDHADPEPSLIHWYQAAAPLVAVPGAFGAEEINTSHRRKATSFPATFNELVSTLVEGFAAATNGTAFQKEAA